MYSTFPRIRFANMDPESRANDDDTSHAMLPQEGQHHVEVNPEPPPIQTPNRGQFNPHLQRVSSQTLNFSYEMMQEAYASSPASPMVRSSPSGKDNRPTSAMYDEPLVTAEHMRSLYSQAFPAAGNSPVRSSVSNRTATGRPLSWTRVLTQQHYQGGVRPSQYVHSYRGPIRFEMLGKLYTQYSAAEDWKLTCSCEERQADMYEADEPVQHMPNDYISQVPGSSQFIPGHQNTAIPSVWQPSSPPDAAATKGMGSMWRYQKPNPAELTSPLTRRANTTNAMSSSSPPVTPPASTQTIHTRRMAKPPTFLKEYAHLAARRSTKAPVTTIEDTTDEDAPPPETPRSTASSTHLDITTDPAAPPSASSNYPGGIRAWLAFAVQQADNTQNHRHPKPKYYSTTPVVELQRLLLDEPDVARRAQRFLHDLTGAKIPRRHRFWSTAKGREMIWAVEVWRERVKFETVRFDDGEWMSVVDF